MTSLTNARALDIEPSDRVLAVVPTDEASDHDLFTTWQTLRRATSTVDVRLHAALSAVQLPAQSVEALAWLARVPNRRLTMSRLASSLGVTSGGLTKLVDRLVQDRLVHRQYSEQDRRVIFAVLTDEGVDLVRRAMPVYVDQLRAEFGHLGRAGLGELRAVCDGFAGNTPAVQR